MSRQTDIPSGSAGQLIFDPASADNAADAAKLASDKLGEITTSLSGGRAGLSAGFNRAAPPIGKFDQHVLDETNVAVAGLASLTHALGQVKASFEAADRQGASRVPDSAGHPSVSSGQ